MNISSNLIGTEEELRKIGVSIDTVKEDLTLPNQKYLNMRRFSRFPVSMDSHICYLRKIGDEYVIPRYYTKVSVKDDRTIGGRELKSKCRIKLRDYQEKFIHDNLSVITDNTGILLEAPCGHGKTILGIWLSFLRGVQTMVLVPTYYLAKQWRQRISECSDATSVILRSSDSKVPTDCDFTIVVMDLFSCRTLPEELVNNIGHVILDEAHRAGAETYLPILDEIPARYRTALTATFRRSDGVHRILKYYFGELIQMKNRFPKPYVYAVRTNVSVTGVISKNKKYERFLSFMDTHSIPYKETKSVIHFTPDKSLLDLAEKDKKVGDISKVAYQEIASCVKRGSEMSYSVVDSYLNEHSGRRKTAIRVIQQCLDSGRTVLFLSKRKDTLRSLHKYFASYKSMLIVSETTERSSEDEAYLQNTCPLILGVTQLAKEGLDIDRLDTLIIHLPMKDTEQAIGRISRLCEGKKYPVCIYLLDDCPITYAVYNNAKKFFKINAEFKGERTLQTLNTVL